MCDEMKRKVKEAYQKRVKLLMKTHHDGKNLFEALITWAISVIRYSVSFLGLDEGRDKRTGPLD